MSEARACVLRQQLFGSIGERDQVRFEERAGGETANCEEGEIWVGRPFQLPGDRVADLLIRRVVAGKQAQLGHAPPTRVVGGSSQSQRIGVVFFGTRPQSQSQQQRSATGPDQIVIGLQFRGLRVLLQGQTPALFGGIGLGAIDQHIGVF